MTRIASSAPPICQEIVAWCLWGLAWRRRWREHTSRTMQSAFVGQQLAFRPSQQLGAASKQLQTAARRQLLVQASVQAAPATLPVRKMDGADAGSASISLKVAEPDTANGLVHR